LDTQGAADEIFARTEEYGCGLRAIGACRFGSTEWNSSEAAMPQSLTLPTAYQKRAFSKGFDVLHTSCSIGGHKVSISDKIAAISTGMHHINHHQRSIYCGILPMSIGALGIYHYIPADYRCRAAMSAVGFSSVSSS
jgi:hypothetical protein